MDLCLQLRLFERDALELSSQFELWGEQLQHGEIPRSMKEAEVRHISNFRQKSEKKQLKENAINLLLSYFLGLFPLLILKEIF